MALLWFDGFESYGTNGDTITKGLREAGYYMGRPFSGDTNPKVSSFTRRGIGLSLLPNTWNYNGGPQRMVPDNTTQLYVGVAICIPAPLLPGYDFTPGVSHWGGTSVLSFNRTSAHANAANETTYDDEGIGPFQQNCNIAINEDLSIAALYPGGLSGQWSAPGVITPGLWQYLEVCLDSANSLLTIRLDGIVVVKAAWTVGYLPVNTVMLNAAGNAGVGFLAVDDFYICDSSGTNFNSFLGDVVVHDIAPASVGNAANYEAISFGSDPAKIINYNLTYDGAATFTSGATSGDQVLLVPSPFPVDFIDVLAVAVVATSAGYTEGDTPINTAFQMGLSLNGDTAFIGAVQGATVTPFPSEVGELVPTSTIAAQIWSAQPLGGPWSTQVAQATQFGVYFPAPAATTFSSIVMRCLATYSPDYGFIDMIVDDVFPNDISYDSVGSTRFATDVTVVDSGGDQRIQRWSQPLMEYDVAYGVRTMEQLMALIAFFRSMKGRVTAFNYLDHVDFTSSIPTSYEARRAPAVGPFDQTVGAGDGQTTSFQLTKTYATATQSQVRPIYRPVPGTVRMGVNGKETTFFTVSAQGVVTFTSPLSVTSKGAVSIPAGQGDYTTLTGRPGDFTALKAFAASNWSVSVTGFTNAAPNVVFSQGVTVVEVATDGSWVTLCYPHSYPLLAETSAGPITITMSPAPPPNTAITAGYQFYVPVRFDTDTLPIALHEYGVGGANSVKLIEVRPTSWG